MVSRPAAMAFLMVMSGLALRADECANSAEAAEGESSAAATSPTILSAVIDADGKVLRSSSRVTVNKTFSKPGFEVGCYEVIFEESVQNGTYVATIESPGTAAESFGRIKVAARTNNSKAVFVQTADVTGKPVNLRFHLLVVNGSVASGGTPPIGLVDRTVEVEVHRHSSVSLSSAEADRILAEMGRVLHESDGAGDIATRIEFKRVGNVQVLPGHIPGLITTKQHLDALFAAGRGIKVVRGIHYCNGTSVPNATIIGCAGVRSGIVNEAVVRFTNNPVLEGILWAHEYGHNCGRLHRDHNLAVMHPSVNASRRFVNNDESFAYLHGPQAAIIDALAATDDDDDAGTEHSAKLKDFLTSIHVHGFPAEEAAQFTTPEDFAALLQLLENPGEEYADFLPNIVQTLCYSRDNRAVEPLMRFVRGPLGSPAAILAKRTAVLHLGDLVNATQNAAALDFLKNLATEAENAQALASDVAEAADQAGNDEDESILAMELRICAIQGLGMTGTEAAGTALEQVRAEAKESLEKERPDPNQPIDSNEDEIVHLQAVMEAADDGWRDNFNAQTLGGDLEYRLQQECNDCGADDQ